MLTSQYIHSQQKFLRWRRKVSKVKHCEFTKWIEEYYPTLNDEEWSGIIDEDHGINY